jgi:predicted sulfurtransferase
MTYVDDDDFDEVEPKDAMQDELEADEAGRCDECGLVVKKDDAIVCPACTAIYHEWCAGECNRCKTPLKGADGEEAKPAAPGRRTAPRAAPRKRAPARKAKAR